MPGGLSSAPRSLSNGPGAEIAIASGSLPSITVSIIPRSAVSGETEGVGSRRTVPIAASRPTLAAILVPPMSRSAITWR